ncbi:MAG TPA: A/G-specific adenine glycosylase [Clostridiaceae bacterium]|nr:A/G-specific adenine glycosylase [Clostridiaceae bacterium]
MSSEVNQNRLPSISCQLTVADLLLSWFDLHARDLPWRKSVPHPISSVFLNRLKEFIGDKVCRDRLTLRRDPYTVVVSELMLQQTQVSAVIPYYERFMECLPTVEVLALADEMEVLKLWEGLGYYRRARSLSALAKHVVENYKGMIPPNKKVLLSLPGIGPYTAGAILSFAYDLPEPAVDGNVVRIFSRLDAQPHVRGDVKASRFVRDRVQELMPDERAGDFNESLMDVGATICTPSSPACAHCPLKSRCQAYALDAVDQFPLRKDSEEKPIDQFSYVLLHRDDLVYVQRRQKGLLEGLFEFYSLAHHFGLEEEASICKSLHREFTVERCDSLLSENERVMSVHFVGERKAVYSHRMWEVSCWEVELISRSDMFLQIDAEAVGDWVTLEELSELPFPTVLVPWRDAFVARHR